VFRKGHAPILGVSAALLLIAVAGESASLDALPGVSA
jgi:hypothetical protein